MLRIGQFQLEGALERITMGLSNRPLQDSAKKRLIAYHEVGHALVASLLPAANAVDKVTILPGEEPVVTPASCLTRRCLIPG